MNPNLRGRSVQSWLDEIEAVLSLTATHPDLLDDARSELHIALRYVPWAMSIQASQEEGCRQDEEFMQGLSR